MSVIVRSALPADYARAGELTVAAFREGGTSPTAEYNARLRDVAGRAESGEVLLAADEATGEVVGAVAFVVHGSPYADVTIEGEAEFRMLAVDPAAQGSGAGAALVHACLARARDLGMHAVTINTTEQSVAACHLYERIGFVRLPERDRDIGHGVQLIAYRIPLT